MPFILLGDSAQEDPEIYREIMVAYPTRILAAYIRNVNRDLKRPEAIRKLAAEVLEKGGTLLMAKDSLAIAEHACSRGWLEAADLAEVRRELDREGAFETGKAQGLAQAEKISGPPAAAKSEMARGGIEAAVEAGKGASPPPILVSPSRNSLSACAPPGVFPGCGGCGQKRQIPWTWHQASHFADSPSRRCYRFLRFQESRRPRNVSSCCTAWRARRSR